MSPNDADSSLVEQWRNLLALHATTWCELDRQLHELHGIGASEFEVLDLLSDGCSLDGTPTLRVQELAGSTHLSQSALSRLVGRLEKDGLVARSMCSDDRRGVYVCITDAGRERCTQARPTHREVLGRLLGDADVRLPRPVGAA